MINERSPFSDVVTWRLVRALLIAGLVVAGGAALWMVANVLDRVHNTLLVIIFSILFAYVVYPPIKWLAARGVPIALAGIIVYVVLGAAVIGAIAWLEPAVATQAADLSKNFPEIVRNTQAQISDPTHSPLLGRLPSGVRDTLASNAGKAGAIVGGVASGFGSHALAIVSGTTTAIINVFLVLGLTLLVIGDLAPIQRFGVRIVPRAQRRGAMAFMRDVDGVIGGFVRGQVLLALGVSVVGTIVLYGVGVPYAILIGLLAGIVSIVPLIGPVVAVIPVVAVAFFTVGIVKMLIVLALYAVILGVQQNVLNPLVNARTVGVTPLVVFVSLLIGSEAFGILGALLSIPIAGIIRVATERLFPPDLESDALLNRARSDAGEPPLEANPITPLR